VKRHVSICDWLPPEFGAVGQYSLQFARDRALAGMDVTLVGLSSAKDSIEVQSIGAGKLRVIRIFASTYNKSRFLQRALWTLRVNLLIIWRSLAFLRAADEILFTGSPPFFLHFIAPFNIFLRKRLIYRITDFHPECLMAELPKVPFALKCIYRMTLFWRRRIQAFEALGQDQIKRLSDIGIAPDKVALVRDPSPVAIAADQAPLALPSELLGSVVLLYSGNFGVAHDHETFIAAYQQHHASGSGRVMLWLNATGAKADLIESLLREKNLPVHRSKPVPLEQLPALLVSPHAHLICLRDEFVGFVLPSKVYGCVQSQKDVLFIGSAESDVHLIAKKGLTAHQYSQVQTGDVRGAFAALERLAEAHAGTPV
jgi:hypothetical protein